MNIIKQFNNLVLSKRLILLMLFIGLVPLITVSVTNIISAHNAIYNAEYRLLQSLKFAKKDQIESYFEQMRNQVSVLAENKTIVEALKDFSTGLDKLPDDLALTHQQRNAISQSVERYFNADFSDKYASLNEGKKVELQTLLPNQQKTLAAQYLYISRQIKSDTSNAELAGIGEESRYAKAHDSYHPEFKRYLEKFYFYDMFLIDANSGDIVYSVYKEIDFATNLTSGPYRSSGLAKVYQKARQLTNNQQAAVVDFEYYTPSYDKPASFIGAPIYENGKLLGVLAFQMPIAVMNKILDKTEGMGKTVEVYLVGRDKLMRSQSRFSEQNTVITAQVDTLAVEQVFAGKDDVHTMLDYRGQEVISSFSRLDIPGLDWAIIGDVDTNEALAAIESKISFNLLIGLISAIVVTLIAIFFSRGIANPLNSAVDIAKMIAGGKLDNKIVSSTDCEVGNLLRSLGKMQNKLNARLQADRKALAENTRIKQALDNISSNMLVIDINHQIVYCNLAMSEFLVFAQQQIAQLNPIIDVQDVVGKASLIDLIPHAADQVNAIQEDDQDVKERAYEITLQELQITLITNPVLDSEGVRLGTVIEWKDRTLELGIEREVQVVVNNALQGKLSNRISLDKKEGFFASLSSSVNQLVGVSEGITNDILRVTAAMANGDLSQKMEADYAGVYGELKRNVNATSDKLKEVVSQIQASASFVKLGTSEITMANLDLNKRTEEQSASLQQTTTSMATINEQMQQSAKISQQASELVDQSRTSALQGGEVVDLTLKAMIDIEHSSKKIAEVISVIDSISFQINLLALNAAVEAARVGELGRGFGVVASEVRKLASISAESAKEISASINASNEKVKEGMRLAYESGDKLTEIVGSVNKAAEFVKEIATTNIEQSNSVAEINTSINYIDEIAIQNAAMVEQATKASEHLGEQAHQLEKMTSFFSLVENVHNDAYRADTQSIQKPSEYTDTAKLEG